MSAALEVRGLTVRLGATDAVRRLDLDLAAGTVTGLIGPNGAGKTSALDAISGLAPAQGTVALNGVPVAGLPSHRRARLGLARTFQSLELFEDLTVEENLLVAGGEAGAGDDRMPAELSQAERSGLALDRALAARPSVLLLDEPATGLDRAGRVALARRLRRVADSGAAVLLVDHDMGLVLEVCDHVVVLDAGRVIAEGPPATIRVDRGVLAAYLGRPAAASDPSAATPSRGSTGRSAGHEVLLDARKLTAGHAGVAVVHGVDLTVGAGEVVALLGLNGAGKTTTMLAVAGLLPRMGGDVTVLGGRSPTTHRLARRGLACVRQGQIPFAGLTVAEHLRLAGGGGSAVLDRLPALRPLLGRTAGLLSGGEARMLALAMALATRPKLLLVDELSMGLAPQVVESLLCTVGDLAADHGAGVLIVEQHPHLALAVADRGYVLQRGRVVASGPTAELDGAGIVPI